MTEVADVLADVDVVLLDFDGPICSLFAGYPAPLVARDLSAVLASTGIVSPEALAADPLEILRWVAAHHPDRVSEADHALSQAERKAALSAVPTTSAHDVIVAAEAVGRAVAIVSNNSTEAIRDYLAIHHLTPHVAFIAGRAHGEPELMKPHRDSVERALKFLGVPARSCAFVGDSVTDVEVSKTTGVRAIGYAKNPARRTDLIGAGAEVVVDSMHDIATALAAA